MMTDEDMEQLAGSEPRMAFRKVERMAAARLAAAKQACGDHNEPEYSDFDYMSVVLPAADVFGIGEITGYELPHAADSDYSYVVHRFKAEAQTVSNKIFMEYVRDGYRDPNTVALDATTKIEVQFYLNKIKEIAAKLDVTEQKRDSITKAILKLELELSKARTGTGAVLDFVAETVTGLEPMVEFGHKILDLIDRARGKETAQRQLPAPPSTKRLPAPEPKKSFEKQLDDEIPF